MALQSGDRLGRYEIRSLIGSGGMGEVYLAHDTKLERKVALKLLLGQYTTSEDRLLRFAKEARAASGLNHPNIVTVYDVDADNGTHFIATEFIEGETLRSRLRRGRIPLSEGLRIATQVADALAAAHREGIVHRDIKPENILVRPDGYVKIVDFGLAKLAGGGNADAEMLATTRAAETRAGVILGTVAYMSPEQARGLSIDARSDVWSLGVVLYEMIAGRRPFDGATTSDVISVILQRDPPKLAPFVPDAAGEVELVVETMLAKVVDERYQNARDVLNALQRVRKHLDTKAEIDRVMPPAVRRAARASVVIALVALVIGIAGYASYQRLTREQASGRIEPFGEFKISRLTSTSRVLDAAISPDGRYVVHSVDNGPGQSLWVRQVNTTSNVEIVPSADVFYIGMTFSNDGDYIYYVTRGLERTPGSLYRVPVLGGVPRKLTDNVDTSVTFSPDGARIAFVRGDENGSTSMIVANADGTEQRPLATASPPSSFGIGTVERIGPAWSPDGKTIATPIETTDAAGHHYEIAVIDTADGARRSLPSRRWYFVRRVAWLADGGGLLAAAADTSRAYSSQQIWHIPFPSGEPRKITHDLSNYAGVSMTSAGRGFVTVQTSTLATIGVAPNGHSAAVSVLTTSATTLDGVYGLTWTRGGEILYSSAANGTIDLWIMKADGSGRRLLASNDGASLFPDVSRDGNSVVLASDRESNDLQIWRIGIDGTGILRLTGGDTAWTPKTLHDGWVIYGSGNRIWRVPMSGGAPVLVTSAITSRPAVSPNGRFFACSYRENDREPSRVAIYAIEGKSPLQVFDIPATADRQTQWAPDGQSLHYIDTRDGVSNIWSLDLHGRRPTPVTDFRTDRIFSFAWSDDGKSLALSRGSIAADAVLITTSATSQK